MNLKDYHFRKCFINWILLLTFFNFEIKFSVKWKSKWFVIQFCFYLFMTTQSKNKKKNKHFFNSISNYKCSIPSDPRTISFSTSVMIANRIKFCPPKFSSSGLFEFDLKHTYEYTVGFESYPGLVSYTTQQE